VNLNPRSLEELRDGRAGAAAERRQRLGSAVTTWTPIPSIPILSARWAVINASS
jgi:hypothetical protein